jgi:hypothetical protein
MDNREVLRAASATVNSVIRAPAAKEMARVRALTEKTNCRSLVPPKN